MSLSWTILLFSTFYCSRIAEQWLERRYRKTKQRKSIERRLLLFHLNSIEIKLLKIHKANVYKLSIRFIDSILLIIFLTLPVNIREMSFWWRSYHLYGHSPPTINELNQFAAVRKKKYSAWLEFPLKWHVPIKIARSGQAAAGDNDGCCQMDLHRRSRKKISIEHRFFIGRFWWCTECTHVCAFIYGFRWNALNSRAHIVCLGLVSAQMVEKRKQKERNRQNRWTRSNVKLRQ